jgi:glycosyltransferase involved in cell wall biosynthesis
VPNAVADGVTGWLAPAGDAGALGERLLALAQDPQAASRMGEAGRARVDEFSASHMVRRLEQLYERLAEEAGLRG